MASQLRRAANIHKALDGWINESNANGSDNAYATTFPAIFVGNEQPIIFRDFGFSIPSGATFDGMELKIERKMSGAGVTDNTLAYAYYNGSFWVKYAAANNNASASAWPASDGVATYGGPTSADSYWGTLPNPFNDAAFAIVLNVYGNDFKSSSTAYVDDLTVEVFYTGGGGGGGSSRPNRMSLLGVG